MKTIGHHTCLNKGCRDSILQDSPFLAIHQPKDNINPKSQFLGTGYYFWDNNINLARTWGKYHCQDKYAIIQIDIDITEKTCFDLVGNRNHMQIIQKIIQKFNKQWSISQCIEFLKDKTINQYFPFEYECVRALDYVNLSHYTSHKVYFIEKNKHYTILDPKITICILDKKYINSHTKRLVFTK